MLVHHARLGGFCIEGERGTKMGRRLLGILAVIAAAIILWLVYWAYLAPLIRMREGLNIRFGSSDDANSFTRPS
jgi:hypothetical protein